MMSKYALLLSELTGRAGQSLNGTRLSVLRTNQQILPRCKMSASLLITRMEETSSSMWSPNPTKLLIPIWKANQTNFTSGKTRKKETWNSIADISKSADGVAVRMTPEQCANEWKNLKTNSKKQRSTTKKTHRERKTCAFYDELTDSTDLIVTNDIRHRYIFFLSFFFLSS